MLSSLFKECLNYLYFVFCPQDNAPLDSDSFSYGANMPHPVNLPSTLLCEDDSDRKTDSLGIPSSTILYACPNGSDHCSL